MMRNRLQSGGGVVGFTLVVDVLVEVVVGASRISENTSSGSFLLPLSSWLPTPIYSLAAFIEISREVCI